MQIIKYIKATLLFVLILINSNSSLASTDVINIAVNNFSLVTESPEYKWLETSCPEAIISKLASTNKVKFVERQYINKIIEELKLQASGIIDENTAVDIGNLVGVKNFIYGSATIVADKVVLRTRIVDVESSKILSSQEVSGLVSEIFSLQDKLSAEIGKALNLGDLGLTSSALPANTLSSAAANKLDRIKKMAASIPFFALDPARNRKSSEYMMGINMCEDVIEKAPTNAEAYYYKAMFSVQNNDLVGAEEACKQAKQLNPKFLEPILLRAFLFQNQGKLNEAIGALKFAALSYPTDSRVYYAMSKVNYDLGYTSTAIENLIYAVNLSPYIENAEGNLRSLILSNPNLYEQSFSIRAMYLTTLVYRALYDPSLKINQEVYNMANEAKQSLPNTAILHYVSGLYEYKTGDYNKSLLSLHKSLELNPGFAFVHRDIGYLYVKTSSCYLGKNHLTIYLKTAAFISDFNEVNQAINNCR